MNEVIYKEPRTFEKYDETHFIAYLNENIIPDYVPEVANGESAPEPVTGYSYQGPMADGGTLIEAKTADRDSLINGIIRSRYTQTEEDAIKTHQIQVLKDPSIEKAQEYNDEWALFNEIRETAIRLVDRWLS